jgi:hypothetical protein
MIDAAFHSSKRFIVGKYSLFAESQLALISAVNRDRIRSNMR